MKIKDRIKEILQDMINNGEFEKIIKYEGYIKKDREETAIYYKQLKEVLKKYGMDNVPIIPLIVDMPKLVAQDVLSELLVNEIKENKND